MTNFWKENVRVVSLVFGQNYQFPLYRLLYRVFTINGQELALSLLYFFEIARKKSINVMKALRKHTNR